MIDDRNFATLDHEELVIRCAFRKQCLACLKCFKFGEFAQCRDLFIVELGKRDQVML